MSCIIQFNDTHHVFAQRNFSSKIIGLQNKTAQSNQALGGYNYRLWTIDLFIHQFIVFMCHTVTVKLETHISHTVFHNLSPSVVIIVVQRQNLIF